MIYIEKISIQEVHKNESLKPLFKYIETERTPTTIDGVSMRPSYNRMRSDNRGDTVKLLEKQLLLDAKYTCCFCQDEIIGKSYLLEHFLPQSLYKNNEVDYYNLFLCCNNKDQCSDKKGNYIIPKFITHPKCETFFRFTWSGEVLPKCSFASLEHCREGLSTLDDIQLEAYSTVNILNLNRKKLVDARLEVMNKDNFKRIRSKSITMKVLKEEWKKRSEVKNGNFFSLTSSINDLNIDTNR